MIDVKEAALAGIDAAFQGGIARLFDVYHRREQRDGDALDRFTSGFDTLLTDYQEARQIIDSRLQQ